MLTVLLSPLIFEVSLQAAQSFAAVLHLDLACVLLSVSLFCFSGLQSVVETVVCIPHVVGFVSVRLLPLL